MADAPHERLKKIAYALETGYFRDDSPAVINYALSGADLLRELAAHAEPDAEGWPPVVLARDAGVGLIIVSEAEAASLAAGGTRRYTPQPDRFKAERDTLLAGLKEELERSQEFALDWRKDSQARNEHTGFVRRLEHLIEQAGGKG